MASRLFGLLFSQRSPEDLIELSEESDGEDYITTDLARKVLIIALTWYRVGSLPRFPLEVALISIFNVCISFIFLRRFLDFVKHF